MTTDVFVTALVLAFVFGVEVGGIFCLWVDKRINK